MMKLRAVMRRDTASGQIVAYFSDHPETRARATTLDEVELRLRSLAPELYPSVDDDCCIETVGLI